jgi:hypothetical protein
MAYGLTLGKNSRSQIVSRAFLGHGDDAGVWVQLFGA